MELITTKFEVHEKCYFLQLSINQPKPHEALKLVTNSSPLTSSPSTTLTSTIPLSKQFRLHSASLYKRSAIPPPELSSNINPPPKGCGQHNPHPLSRASSREASQPRILGWHSTYIFASGSFQKKIRFASGHVAPEKVLILLVIYRPPPPLPPRFHEISLRPQPFILRQATLGGYSCPSFATVLTIIDGDPWFEVAPYHRPPNNPVSYLRYRFYEHLRPHGAVTSFLVTLLRVGW